MEVANNLIYFVDRWYLSDYLSSDGENGSFSCEWAIKVQLASPKVL
jgi:hypothetical protein